MTIRCNGWMVTLFTSGMAAFFQARNLDFLNVLEEKTFTTVFIPKNKSSPSFFLKNNLSPPISKKVSSTTDQNLWGTFQYWAGTGGEYFILNKLGMQKLHLKKIRGAKRFLLRKREAQRFF